jgi:TRAP-type C4-dicarboxylate transport system substrate-binding protein
LATHHAPKSDSAICVDTLCEMIEEETGGRVKVTPFHAEALGKVTDYLDMTKRGVCQMADIPYVFSPGAFDLILGTELPMLGVPNRSVTMTMMWELFYQGYFKGFDDYKMIAFKTSPPCTLFLRDKKVLTIEDFDGLKLRAPGPELNELWGRLGATAVAIPFPEVYMSLDRGMIDGIATGYEALTGAKMYEVTKYCIWRPGLSAGAMACIMSKDVWNSLPPDIQVAIDKVTREFRYEYMRYYQDQDKKAPEILREYGMEVYSLSDSEAAKVQEAAAPITDEWIAKMEAKGLPGGEMIDNIRKIVSRYE